MRLSDKERLDYTLSMLRRTTDARLSWPVSPAEAAAIVAEVDRLHAEVERLRGERDHFREAWAAAQVRIDCGTDAVEAVRGERAAVVAWLRREIQKCGCDDDTAACIERGEHRREGEE